MKIKNTILALFIGGAFFACVGDVGETLLTDHANRLLSADSFKIWNRIERLENGSEVDINSCAENHVLVFLRLAQEADTIYRYSQAFDCDAVLPIELLKANYEMLGNVNNQFTNEILLSNEDTASLLTLEVMDITSRYLRIRFDEEGTEVEEIFTFDFE